MRRIGLAILAVALMAGAAWAGSMGVNAAAPAEWAVAIYARGSAADEVKIDTGSKAIMEILGAGSMGRVAGVPWQQASVGEGQGQGGGDSGGDSGGGTPAGPFNMLAGTTALETATVNRVNGYELRPEAYLNTDLAGNVFCFMNTAVPGGDGTTREYWYENGVLEDPAGAHQFFDADHNTIELGYVYNEGTGNWDPYLPFITVDAAGNETEEQWVLPEWEGVNSDYSVAVPIYNADGTITLEMAGRTNDGNCTPCQRKVVLNADGTVNSVDNTFQRLNPTQAQLGPDGRQYWFDSDTKTVKVFSPTAYGGGQGYFQTGELDEWGWPIYEPGFDCSEPPVATYSMADLGIDSDNGGITALELRWDAAGNLLLLATDGSVGGDTPSTPHVAYTLYKIPGE